MAATLSALKLPTLPPRAQSKLYNLPTQIQSKLNPNNQITLKDEPQQLVQTLKSYTLPLSTVALPFILDTQDALAVQGQFGLLEGRTAALVHPLAMGGLFLYTLYAGYLGWQWRRIRTIQNEINELKKQVKPVAVASDGSPADKPAPPSPIETKIQQLSEDRKDLLKGNFRDKHFNAGSILLGFGVFEAVGGGFNTWFRTGKLFPGPHLFAGAAITVLWAAAAALVPAMQKGNETARSLHIALNAINVILFVWQIPTGIEIVFKVFEFTNWP
ncbi:unnamed protein product [Amaranthus hypochondriacus]